MNLNKTIQLKRYPELRMVAQHMDENTFVSPHQALGLYERGWRSIDKDFMSLEEKELLEKLIKEEGKGLFNV